MGVSRHDTRANFLPLHYYLAGHRVPPGTYRQVEGQRSIRLDHEGVLPATCDGRVAVYVRETDTWADRQRRNQEPN